MSARIVPDLSFADYLDAPAHWSQVWPAATSSMHAAQWTADNRPPSAAMVLGSAIHCAALEPEAFADRYRRAPDFDGLRLSTAEVDVVRRIMADGPDSYRGASVQDRRSKADKEAWDAESQQADADGVVLVRRDTWAAVCALLSEYPAGCTLLTDDQLRTVDALRPLILREIDALWRLTPPQTEVSVVGATIHGVKTCGRLDAVGGLLFADLKTSARVSDHEAATAFRLRGYAGQAWSYREQWRQATGDLLDFRVVWAQTEPPYFVAVQALDADGWELGRQQAERAFRNYRRWQDTGKTEPPTLSPTVRVPRWALEE